MRIDKVELIGFKSFSERTIFNLHPGITCIVGPNGCGKSNIVDAFKWVLGEQSAKSLRGDKMEEVIFGGTQSKKPRGMAEVALYLSGMNLPAGGLIPSDSSNDTAIVTRRLYRSGDSEYLINKSTCRLKDIRDLFLDTGLEMKSYSILEQDRIAAILNAKPEDRRFIIEEVAGVIKYKVRRAEALSKLESSKNNLQRINDIVAEVKRQINSLDRQVKKAERYKRLMEEIKTIELRLAKHDFTSLHTALDAITSELDLLKEEDAGLRAELSKNEAELETSRLLFLEREKETDEWQRELQGKERKIADLERKIAVLKTDKDNLVRNTGRLRQEAQEVVTKIAEAETRKTEIAGRKAEIDIEIEAMREDLRIKTEALGAKEGEIAEHEKQIEARRKDLFSVSEELSKLRNELNMQCTFIENLDRKAERAKAETAESGTALEGLQLVLGGIGSETVAKRNEIQGIKEDVDSTTIALATAKEKTEAVRANLSGRREELASLTSRLESLLEMLTGGEPFEEIHHIAYITEIIDVAGEYEKAVEGALREAIMGLILSDKASVSATADSLREKELERTALFALDLDRTLPDKPAPAGTIGRAIDFVKTKPEYSAIVGNLLSGVVIVKDIMTAFEINDAGYTFVTLDGDVVEPSGAVIAGMGKGILKRKRQIRELEVDIEEKKVQIEKRKAELDAGVALVAEKEAFLRSLSSRVLDAERSLQALSQRGEKTKEDIERTERKMSFLRVEMEEAQRERASIESLCNDKEASIKRAEELKIQIESSIALLHEEMAGRKAMYEAERNSTVEIKLSINSGKEKHDSLENEFRSLVRLQAELEGKTGYIARELQTTEESIVTKEAEVSESDTTLKGVVVEATELKNKINTERENMAHESETLRGNELHIKTLRNKIDERSQKISSLDVSKAEHKLKIGNLEQNIKNAYDISLESIEAEEPAEDDGEKLAGLKTKVQELGPVSLGTIEEYEELKTRYDFLTGQKNDIEQSIAELEEAIKKINSTTRQKLRDAYDSLNAKFGEIFVLLFGGGKAELQLTDESNILETGIEIVVQPPGKKLQNITLLSGGEKSMTAMSLLFASFLLKPTPLCILDEADAALDESNAERFSKMLRTISQETQFVVVTHNRVTMESADYIYGITMEEPGTSKVISMELVEAVATVSAAETAKEEAAVEIASSGEGLN